eukprot:snap_masked-scaffold_22-processed-gene-2.34-mRNA-1 protein AED:1.00 eAED:1.00 QI:0/-1/0/0/-1/1/1/0/183
MPRNWKAPEVCYKLLTTDKRYRGRPILGIDHGEKILGAAISSASLSFAFPLQTISNGTISPLIGLADKVAVSKIMNKRKSCFETLGTILSKHNGAAIVYGWPITEDQKLTPQCKKVHQFALDFNEYLAQQEREDVLVTFWSEHLSTVEARERIKTGLTVRKKNRRIDDVAASVILQNYLKEFR